MLYTKTFDSPLGKIQLLSDQQKLLGIWFIGQKYFGANYDLTTAQKFAIAPLTAGLNWLKDYFAGQKPNPEKIPLAFQTSRFRQTVLQTLLTIPYGQTMTYSQLAKHVAGSAKYTRAVAQAVARNPFLIIIPCHRVIGSRGQLTGYAGGIKRKKTLLGFEKSGRVIW